MKVSLSWLNEYVSVDMDVSALADALTMAGLEVDTVTDRYEYLRNVLTGRVLSVSSHPNADKLKICKVDIGENVISVVCGAPNVRKDSIGAVALPGMVFPDGRVLEKGVIRGEESEGMLCSETELGIGPDASEIMVLNSNISVGIHLAEALNLSDTVIEIDLTPNRPDCLSIIGIAREVAVFQGTTITYPDIPISDSDRTILDYTSVTIDDPERCPRYAAKLVFDITVAPSPFWLQDRLMSVGLRPVNNIVDITNFVMMETGQPLHAFDFDRLSENRIVVRCADKGETFTTLDQKERALTTNMLMICDGKKPVALAGIMGGMNSEIDDSTTRVFLESAYFDPVCIRKTSKKLSLNTDASHRFERGVDPAGTVAAMNRAAQLMAEMAGGRLIGGSIDNHPAPICAKKIILDVKQTNNRLGTDLNRYEMSKYLKSIEFTVEDQGDTSLSVVPPFFRVDVSRPEDLMEEVARLSGYNNIPTTFPHIPAEVRLPVKLLRERGRIRNLMTGFGYTEVVNYSFIHPSFCDNLQLNEDDSRRNVVEILNPLTEDQAVLRTSLIPGLLKTMHHNTSHQIKNIRIFEIGKTFFSSGKDNQPDEVEFLSGLLTGSRFDLSWHFSETECDFYDIKGVVEELLNSLRVDNIKFTSRSDVSLDYTLPGHTAQIFAGEERIGQVGRLHPRVLKPFDLKQTAYIFEINLDSLIPHIPDTKFSKSVPRFPFISRDITIIIDKDTESRNILEYLDNIGEQLVEGIHLFDVYEGKPVSAGKKSISFRIIYRSPDQTLEDEQVNSIHHAITGRLIDEFHATLPA